MAFQPTKDKTLFFSLVYGGLHDLDSASTFYCIPLLEGQALNNE